MDMGVVGRIHLLHLLLEVTADELPQLADARLHQVNAGSRVPQGPA